MKILFPVWELAPFIKVGGLGDVARSLPRALYHLGQDIRLIVPYYKALKLHGQRRYKICEFNIIYNKKKVPIKMFKIHFLNDNIPVYLLQNPFYINVPMADTFAVFDLAVIEILKNNILDWQPDIVHCNDNHCGFIPFLVKHNNLAVKTLFTIHNLCYQRKYPVLIVEKMGLLPSQCRIMRWEIKSKQINFLFEGITHADLINTVSPTYSKEILTEEYGEGLDDILRRESSKIFGILNGIDYDICNPAEDPYIPYHYNNSSISDKSKYKVFPFFEGKKLNKRYLQRKLNFSINKDIPLIGYIGRIAGNQKGIDLIHKMMLRLDLEKYQFVLLGKGDENWEERFMWLAKFYPKNVFFSNIFDEELASQIYAASDFLLIPSKFEPCGLIQMIAMRYGTVPIARATGGLKDTIKSGQDGFLFEKFSSHELEKILKKAIKLKDDNPDKFAEIIKNAMAKDFSWSISAQEYLKSYQKLLSANL
ncbi:glycogen synthase [Candidatus Parcubacteria bacterium]|nr:MAG: glycogen synthase [Candidatus Parcubacteria bacterium]